MKKFRQLAALFLAFAMVIGAFSTPKVVKAEEDLTDTTLAASAVKISYVEERLEVTKAKGETIYYALKYNDKSHTKTVWDEAFEDSDTKALIDFSNTSAAKDVKFFLTNDTEKKPIEITVKAQETTLAVAFSGTAETTDKSKIKVENDWTNLNKKLSAFSTSAAEPWANGYLNVTLGKGKEAKALTPEEVTKLEFKKGATGKWQSITALDLRKFTAQGAQLYFRIAATDTPQVISGAAITGRSSKEVKVTFTKQANAPKVTIDGTTKEIKLAKTQEYRVGVNGSYSSWVKVADNHMSADGKKVNKVYLKDLLTVTSGSAWGYSESKANQSIQVRTAASEKAVASKITTVKLNAVATPSVGTGTSITFTLEKGTTYDKGIKVVNSTGAAIQVAVVSGSSYDVNAKTVKWTTVKAGEKGAIISGKELEKGDTILTRTVAVKDDAKTAANEFKVSSGVAEYKYKDKHPLSTQTLAVSVAASQPLAASASAITAVSGSAYVVTVTNPSSGSAITIGLDVATTHIADGTPKVEVVSTESTAVKLVADGGIKSNSGKLKITITKDAKAAVNNYKVSIDGHTAYVTVKYVLGN